MKLQQAAELHESSTLSNHKFSDTETHCTCCSEITLDMKCTEFSVPFNQ